MLWSWCIADINLYFSVWRCVVINCGVLWFLFQGKSECFVVFYLTLLINVSSTIRHMNEDLITDIKLVISCFNNKNHVFRSKSEVISTDLDVSWLRIISFAKYPLNHVFLSSFTTFLRTNLVNVNGRLKQWVEIHYFSLEVIYNTHHQLPLHVCQKGGKGFCMFLKLFILNNTSFKVSLFWKHKKKHKSLQRCTSASITSHHKTSSTYTQNSRRHYYCNICTKRAEFSSCNNIKNLCIAWSCHLLCDNYSNLYFSFVFIGF